MQNGFSRRIAIIFKIYPSEGVLIALLIGMMFTAAMGSSIGGASIDSLFFTKFDIKNLPIIYVLMGVSNFINLLFMAGLIGNVSRAGLYRGLPIFIALVLIGARLLLSIEANWFYPTLYIGKEILNALQGVFLWGMAGAMLDTRQAKRLYPLLTAGSIAGAAVGSFSTPVLVDIIRTENLLIGWAVMVFITGILVSILIRREKNESKAASVFRSKRGSEEGSASALINEIRDGYDYVSKSPLMRWWSLASVLFAVLWFSLLLPFSRNLSLNYPNTDELTRFLGFFNGTQMVAALVVSVFFSSRLFAKFGLLSMISVFVYIYLAGFATLLFTQVFAVIIGARLIKLIWASSVAEPAWNAVYNAIPLDRRDQARSFVNAVPGQAGIIISGLILLIGDSALQPEQLYFIGLAASIITVYVVWKCKKYYLDALDDALIKGNTTIFEDDGSQDENQFDAETINVIHASLNSTQPGTRRVAVEMLTQIPGRRTTHALTKTLLDENMDVRITALESLNKHASFSKPEPVLALLNDEAPELRALAIQTLQKRFLDDKKVIAKIQPYLQDEDMHVRACAATALALGGREGDAEHVLEKMFTSKVPATRLEVIYALENSWERLNDREISKKIFGKALADTNSSVREAALRIVTTSEQYMFVYLNALGDENENVRKTAALAIKRNGKQAVPRVMEKLKSPKFEEGALLALNYLPIDSERDAILEYVKQKVDTALKDRDLAASLRPRKEIEKTMLLSKSLRARAQKHAILALQAMDLLIEDESITLAIQNIKSRKQLSYALEVLENVPEAEIVRPLIGLWEVTGTTYAEDNFPWDEIFKDKDPWIRACVAFAISPRRYESLLQQAVESDFDELVRETAKQTLAGGDMTTLKTLSMMEKIIFLQKVPLFKDLPLEDLKRIASIAGERTFSDGAYLARFGEMGNEMFINVTGTVRVVSENGNDLDESGEGEYTGEMSILSEEPRIASLIAKGDVRALCIGQKEFEEILRERPEVSIMVMRELCQRIKNTNRD